MIPTAPKFGKVELLVKTSNNSKTKLTFDDCGLMITGDYIIGKVSEFGITDIDKLNEIIYDKLKTSWEADNRNKVLDLRFEKDVTPRIDKEHGKTIDISEKPSPAYFVYGMDD